MVNAFLGVWSLHASENFDDYMKHLKVSIAQRNVAKALHLDTLISKDGDAINIETKSSFKSTKIQFKRGAESDETTAGDRKTKILEDGKLVQTQQWDGKETTLVRELKDGTSY
ncbi:fatty acid-binding protein, liver-like [Scyliorhinus torazame]|uniref:fatty acid-binding protein, liver-like n=1 Tax=Scyliorhinus torazame TaxID=75743 RepID=UPI003B5ABD32